MARAWLVGWVVLGACSFDSAGLGRGTGATSTDSTFSGTDTSTGGPATTTTTTVGTTTTQTTDDSASGTTVGVTLTSGDSSSGGVTSTSTGTGTSTGDASTSSGTTGDASSSSGGSSSSGTTGDASSSSGGGSSGGSSSSGTTGEAPSCVDGVLNGSETDVDCGGPDCSGCEDGGLCDGGSDCISLSCKLGKCAAPSCVDGVVNGSESDVDCGGLACPGCGLGLICAIDDDCVSGICGPKLCVANACENLKQDGQETNIDCGGGCPACVGPILNEVDYDQLAPNDDAEFVELYNPGPSPIDLKGLQLVLVNGANKTPYTTIALGPAGVLKPDGYLVVRRPGLAVAPGALTVDFALQVGNIQNGAPDGLAVVDTLTPALLDALSYEGPIVGATIPPLPPVSLVEGQATPVFDDGAVPGAMCRLPNGSDTNDALTDWTLCATVTPGAANVP